MKDDESIEEKRARLHRLFLELRSLRLEIEWAECRAAIKEYNELIGKGR